MDKDVMYKLFYGGQYQELCAKLQKVTSMGTSLSDQLVLQNNMAVCAASMNRDNHQSYLATWLEIISNCSSGKLSRSLVCVELLAVYNYTYTQLVHHRSEQAVISLLHTIINKTLTRVFALFTNEVIDMDQLPGEGCFTLVLRCLHAASLHVTEEWLPVKWALGQCCLLVVVIGLSTAMTTDALSCLKMAEEVISSHMQTQPSRTYGGIYLPLVLDRNQLPAVLDLNQLPVEKYTDLMCLLSSLCLLSARRHQECCRYLEGIQGDCYIPVAKFLSGFVHYKTGRYSEAISLLMETVRSTQLMTQRLKARVYNLIGVCFQKMEKVMLSVQMFKQALSADFTFLRPLYNVSVQYGQMGHTDLELECLNLMVTGLGMQKGPVGVASLCGLDLLDLVDMEDQDISYSTALYTLAHRAQILNRSDVASDKYLELLSHLKDLKEDIQSNHGLPTLLQIYQQTALCLLEAQRYSECVSLCDNILICYHRNSATMADDDLITQVQTWGIMSSQIDCSGDSDTLTQCSITSSSQSNRIEQNGIVTDGDCAARGNSVARSGGYGGRPGKRKLDEAMDRCDRLVYDTDVVTLHCKAEALMNLGELDSALQCLQRGLDSISSYKMKRYEMLQMNNESHISKKPRLSGTRPTCLSVPSDPLRPNTEYQLYRLMGDILSSKHQPRDATHFYRLAAEIKPEENASTTPTASKPEAKSIT